MKKIISVFAVGSLLLACKKTDTPDPGPAPTPNPYPTPTLYQYNILPSVTHPAITAFNSEHFVYLDTRVTLKNKLFVFLPGTSSFPALYSGILKKAAALGYHAIGLMYPNNSDLYIASSASLNNDQFGLCRYETFTGNDVTAGVTVNADNCIRTRLVKLLQYLQQQNPWQNWQQFLNVSADVNWSKCMLGGHSQGGGHAALIGKFVAMERVLIFSSIDWNSLLNKSANWISHAGLTPSARYYNFIHPQDEIFSWQHAQQQFTDAGIPGASVNIDSVAAPYGNANNLYTRAAPALGIVVPHHNITCLDLYTPKTAGGQLTPAFNSAWEYLLNK